jgi:hypothetical protein
MKTFLLLAALCGLVGTSAADDDKLPAAAASVPPGATQDGAVQPNITRADPTVGAGGSGAASDANAPQFLAEAEWKVAGYNNEEIIYTILVTNRDPRIIRCNVQLRGFYIENGEKQSISDRQTATIFPGQRAPVGNWMGMDQKSGATYTVNCRAI